MVDTYKMEIKKWINNFTCKYKLVMFYILHRMST